MTEGSTSKDLVVQAGLPATIKNGPKKKRAYTQRPKGLARVPPEASGVQSNFCRNVNCENFGVPPMPFVARGPGTADRRDGYRLTSGRANRGSVLLCTKCGQESSVKSNQAIAEEIDRQSAYLAGKPAPPAASCPNQECANHGVAVGSALGLYRSKGRTAAGTKRWRCLACGSSFCASRAPRGSATSHKDADAFRHVVNKAGIRIMARVMGVGAGTVYAKLESLHARCLDFMGDRERRIKDLDLSRLYVSTDRQDYMINWSDRADRNNTQLTAVASADNRSGYVFGMTVNLDPSESTEEIEAHAIVAGDFGMPEPSFRRFARYWTSPDYATARSDDPHGVAKPSGETGNVWAGVRDGYVEMASIPDPEAKERPLWFSRLPRKGAQLHFEYCVHAHYRLLRRLFGPVGKVRFFIDQDDTLRAGCISTFVEEIKAGTADVFYVKIDKGLNNDQRKDIVARQRMALNAAKAAMGNPGASDLEARVHMIEANIMAATLQVTRRDRWIETPDATGGEPLKAVCWLTERTGVPMDVAHLARVYARASMHAIDRYFMQLRRLVMAFERPISMPSNDGRVWRGYSPYDPTRIQQLLDIYRCHYNFVAKGRDGRTPAMRLGLARGPVREQDILYFKG